MSDEIPEVKTDSTSDSSSSGASNSVGNASNSDQTASFSDRYSDVMGQINQTLGKIDWSQMGKYGKAAGILAVVILAQVFIKGILDTINLLPLIPGLLELLGVVVVVQWSWQNLTTSDKRTAVLERVQNLRQEYLG